jgi:predicted permease
MAWYRRLANLVRPGRHADELEREMAFHLAERADELAAGGMSEPEAALAARRSFGNVTALKESTRDAGVVRWLDSALADLRYAGRSLRRSPGLAAVVTLSLGLGIGANAAIFSLVDALLLKPLPVERPERLVQITLGAGARSSFTRPLVEAIGARQDVFDHLFAYVDERFELGAGAGAAAAARTRIDGTLVSGDYFAALGLAPAIGRVLAPGDDVPGCPAVAVVGHGFWRRALGGDPGVVGRALTLDGRPYEIVGVAPRGFTGLEPGREAQLWTPLCTVPPSGDDPASRWYLTVLGTLRDGVDPQAADARLAALAPVVFRATLPAGWNAEQRERYLTNALGAEPAAAGVSDIRDRYGDALTALMLAVGVVLLIACANVANLLVARGTARRREIAVRIALGVSRGRLVRQLLAESLLLASLGAALGLLLAPWGARALLGFLSPPPGPLSRGAAVWLDVSLDLRLLAFTTLAALATALLFGLVPAWRAARVPPQAALTARDGVDGGGRGQFAVAKTLVVAQVAFSLVLLVAAGLLLGTLLRLATLDPGFRRDGVLLATLDLRGAKGGDEGDGAERRRAVYAEVLRRVRQAPGVRSASTSAFMPMTGAGWNGAVAIDGRVPEDPFAEDALAMLNAVSDGWFRTLGTRFVAGRDFGPGDGAGAPKVAVVNEAMARRFFGSAAAAMGRRFQVQGGFGLSEEIEVVGVVQDAKYRSLRETIEPTAYVPLTQDPGPSPTLELQVRGDVAPAALAREVAGVAARVDPEIALELTTLESLVAGSLGRERLLATISGFFGALALLLAVVGLYGTVAYTVTRRRAELGVRIALGATRERVIRMVLGEVGRLLALGIALGAALALAATRLMTGFLYDLAPNDPATLALAALLLAGAGLAAGALPAWRAARVEPMAVLREE